MKKLRIYLDTSVINFVYATDAKDYQKATLDFFKNHFRKFDVYISEVVLAEIEKTTNPAKKSKLNQVIKKYEIPIFDNTQREEVSRLAQIYIREKIIPAKKLEDALHIAVCTVFNFDILLSWNFKHLSNIQKQIAINNVNSKQGYLKPLNLLTPLEVIYEKE